MAAVMDIGFLMCLGVDAVSIWEFSGYESYYVTYDWLIGDVNCLYVVVVDGSQSDEVQLSQISFWLNFIQCRTPLNTPIGSVAFTCIDFDVFPVVGSR